MKEKEFLVIIIEYKPEHEKVIEGFLRTMAKSIETKYGKIRRAYQGSEKRILSALESILGLTE